MQVTSVSKKAQALSDAPAAIFVISNDDIKRSGVTSVPEALRMAPGVEVARIILINGRSVLVALTGALPINFWY